MKNITVQQLEYFQIVMKCASFSEAAQICFTTQSNISKNILSLEQALGQTLFIRQKNGVLPTQKAVLFDLQLSESKANVTKLFDLENVQQSKKELNLGFCQSIYFPDVTPALFKSFQSGGKLSKINVNFHCYEVSDVIKKVENGLIDLGFILSDYGFSNPHIKSKRIVERSPQIFFAKNCPLYNKKRIKVNEFSNYPIVTTKYLVEHNDYRMINSLPFNPKNIIVVDSYDEIKFYLATGSYITVLRPFVDLAYNSDIRSYALHNYGVSQGIFAVWLDKTTNPYLKTALKLIGDSGTSSSAKQKSK